MGRLHFGEERSDAEGPQSLHRRHVYADEQRESGEDYYRLRRSRVRGDEPTEKSKSEKSPHGFTARCATGTTRLNSSDTSRSRRPSWSIRSPPQ